MKRSLIISTASDLVRIAPERIVYIASDGNYSTLVQTDGEMRMLSYQLGQIEKMISSQLGGAEGNAFIRIGKSLIINNSYIYYINVAKQKMTLLSDAADTNIVVCIPAAFSDKAGIVGHCSTGKGRTGTTDYRYTTIH